MAAALFEDDVAWDQKYRRCCLGGNCRRIHSPVKNRHLGDGSDGPLDVDHLLAAIDTGAERSHCPLRDHVKSLCRFAGDEEDLIAIQFQFLGPGRHRFDHFV